MIFRKSVQKIQVSLKSYKNKRYFTWRQTHIYDFISLISSYNEKRFGQKFRENQGTYFMFLFFWNRDFYEIMWKNIVQPGRNTYDNIWRVRIACSIPKATNTHSGCVILIAFPLQQWLQERTSILSYTYIARPVSVNKLHLNP